MSAIVQELLESPRLLEIVDELRARLAEERTRRERFYAELRDDQKVEFINGEVIVHSPNTARHLEVRENLHRLLGTYVELHQLGWVGGEKALCVFPRNDYEPDVCYFGPEKAAAIKPALMKFPIPDWIAEVLSDSTAQLDRGKKFRDYQEHQVSEYWLVDPVQERLEQFVLKERTYELVLKSDTGEARSAVIPGFTIPVRALFDGAANLAVLREILASEG